MKNAREPVWWLPLARRVVLWSIAVGLGAAAAAFFIVSSGLITADRVPPAGHGLKEFTLKISWIGLTSAASYAFLGICSGAVIAFYAPASEPITFWKSAFFRDVLTRTLKFWMLACVVFWFGMCCFIPLLYSFIKPDWLQIANFASVRVLLALSLWRSIELTSRGKA